MSGILSGSFLLTNDNSAATGEASNITADVYRDGGATTDTVSITELGQGAYKFTGEATSADKYHVHIRHSSYEVNGFAAGCLFDIYADAIGDLDNILQHGVGLATYTVTIDITANENPVPGVTLRVTDTNGQALTQTVCDTVNGRASLNLEAGVYRFYPGKPGYSFASLYYERTVTTAGALSAIEAQQLAVTAPSDPGRCRIYHYADDAGAASATLTGTATAYPRPQFQGVTSGNAYTGFTSTEASLQKSMTGLFYFDNLKRGATYLFTLGSENIGATNGVLAIPEDFTGGTDGIAYLVQSASGDLSITTTPPA